MMRQAVEAVAAAYVVGVDGWQVAAARDPLQVAFLEAVVVRAAELQAMRDDALAVRVVNALSKATKRRG